MLLFAFALSFSARGQEFSAADTKSSLSLNVGYSPTSSHILIGESRDRKTITGGVEYTRRFASWNKLRLDYRAELDPFFRESDPTADGYEATYQGYTENRQFNPVRVISKSRQPVGCSSYTSDTCVPIYLIYGPDETTYAAAISPLGARVVFAPHRRIEPTFEADMGVVLSSRDIPVDSSASFNYQFAFGPGLQYFITQHQALRLEYVYRHISNANSGNVNPGIDQGVIRLSICRYH